jgi:multicomponent Na+:H+ antiporter subunit D
MPLLAQICIPIFSIILLPLKKINRLVFYSLIVGLGLVNIFILFKHVVHTEKLDLGFNIVFLMDKYSWLFALVVNFAWIITTIYSYSFILYGFQEKAQKFHFYLSLVLASVLATAFAGNLLTLFVFYLLGIPFIYPLIILRDTPDSHAAGKLYLKSTLLPAIFILLPAISAIYQLEGHFDFGDILPTSLQASPILASILLIMFIIGMSKNCVAPFNNWLPKTMLAPAPVSALVHSVAAVTSGSIALIKIAVYVYGLDFLHFLTSKFYLAGSLTYICGFTALYSAYKALNDPNLKVRFSNSTVSQLSYIITAILIATPTSILGAMLHIVTHSVAKICLFFIAGFYNCVYGTTDVSEIRKIAPSTKLIVLCIGVCGMSIAGFPLLAGYLSKDLMLLEELHSGNYAAAVFLIIGSIINIFYIFPVIKAAFGGQAKTIESKPIPLSMAFAIVACIIGLISLSFYTYNIIRIFELEI